MTRMMFILALIGLALGGVLGVVEYQPEAVHLSFGGNSYNSYKDTYRYRYKLKNINVLMSICIFLNRNYS